MTSQGIEQWDEIYPAKEDFEDDIEKKTLIVSRQNIFFFVRTRD